MTIKRSRLIITKRPQLSNYGDSADYDNDTYFQILLVNPREDKTSGKYIETKIVTKQRKDFKTYLIDHQTREKLKGYLTKENEPQDNIGSYLPSPGAVVISKEFMSISPNYDPVEVHNNYNAIRYFLVTRRLSQLIAKTWWSALQAIDFSSEWNKFKNGQWDKIELGDKIEFDKNSFTSSDFADGLIAREIFLISKNSLPDHFDQPDEFLKNYYSWMTSDKSNEKEKANTYKHLILPGSLAWQGIALSLLIAGQAYYEVKEDGQTHYHQISQPIFTTGEIVNQYYLEVAWDKFEGEIKESSTSQAISSVFSQVILPYPPIPSKIDLSSEDLKRWAFAKEKDQTFPFYEEDDKQIIINVENYLPPYPYIPLTSF